MGAMRGISLQIESDVACETSAGDGFALLYLSNKRTIFPEQLHLGRQMPDEDLLTYANEHVLENLDPALEIAGIAIAQFCYKRSHLYRPLRPQASGVNVELKCAYVVDRPGNPRVRDIEPELLILDDNGVGTAALRGLRHIQRVFDMPCPRPELHPALRAVEANRVKGSGNWHALLRQGITRRIGAEALAA